MCNNVFARVCANKGHGPWVGVGVGGGGLGSRRLHPTRRDDTTGQGYGPSGPAVLGYWEPRCVAQAVVRYDRLVSWLSDHSLLPPPVTMGRDGMGCRGLQMGCHGLSCCSAGSETVDSWLLDGAKRWDLCSTLGNRLPGPWMLQADADTKVHAWPCTTVVKVVVVRDKTDLQTGQVPLTRPSQ